MHFNCDYDYKVLLRFLPDHMPLFDGKGCPSQEEVSYFIRAVSDHVLEAGTSLEWPDRINPIGADEMASMCPYTRGEVSSQLTRLSKIL